ncbi:hypothetical protein FNV43_RR14576 [Rhamnella rubrinervis]|uniref:Protein kinase domain-containing protein n=1 Tax=Rhamnella rubrinervis TaxID=2594499 RepID=A0A8K0H3K5_9ROSA|nr:hypothetical protein FNV43_RR14576 [Rhamnella rubrinervis]
MTTLILFHLFMTFHQLTVAVSDNSTLTSYDPPEKIAIDCGRSGSYKALNDRLWEGDITSKFFTLQGPNNASVASQALHPPTQQGDTITLYRTARLSRSEIKYTIPVTAGPKFIRLHFYPDVYGDLDTSKAFFSVKAAHYTLLRNFSAFLTAAALQREGVVKEFLLNVEESNAPNITLTFAAVSSNSDSFAFINGIEVVSMPTNLYYSAAGNKGAKFVGESQGSYYPIKNDTAMEMVYRINVGGSDVLPAEDTGMYRNWDSDDDYITIFGHSVAPVQYKNNISYNKAPAYTAPRQVYTTARSTGNIKNETLLQSYNLTWEFPVDSGFKFLFRLHFCEIVAEMKRPGDRVFYIFIANETADNHADVISWSGQQYVPVYQDYVVSTNGVGDHNKINLSVALHVNPDRSITAYLDAILNGLEIFKLSDYGGNLAGPNPDPLIFPPPVAQPREPHTDGKNGRPTVIIGIVSGIVSGLFLLSVIGFLIFRRARKVKNSSSVDGTTWGGPDSFTKTKSNKSRCSSLPSDLCRYFSLAEIKSATNKFDDVFIIGRGGFGNVYKGYIDKGTTVVAIKRLKPESSQGANEFRTEIEMLSKLRHLHLVSLIGYCNDDREMILVYEYMAHGTLREHLYNGDNPPLSWKQRLQICIGAARGLHYLHTGAKHTIIHRDVKTTNILLDEKWEAKVSDFGLSRMGPTSMSKAHVSTVVKGSMGYLDPEYYRRQQLTEKSDVYSFGVVLCEVLCARPPLIRSVEKEQMSLAEWARRCYGNGTFDEIVDKHLRGKIAPECLRKYGEIAVSCMADNGSERPTMSDVVWGLEFALQLQQGAEENASVIGALGEMKGEDEGISFLSGRQDDGKFSCSWEDTATLKSSRETKTSSSGQSSDTNNSNKGMSRTVFSEINDPKGR